MKARNNQTYFLPALMAFILLIPMLAASTVSLEKTSSYIVQGSNTTFVSSLVSAVGGELTSTLEIINAVGAMLSPQQVEILMAQPGITITPNAAVFSVGKGNDTNLKVEKNNKPYTPETNYPDVIGADVVWENGNSGDNIAVAIVDTGLEAGSFGDNEEIIAWVDFVGGKKKPDDKNGHGTHIAGIIANSQIGEDGEWNGIAPSVNLVGVRVLNKEGAGTYEQVIQGIQWVIEHKAEYNIRVMNLSLVSPVQSPYWSDPLNLAVTQAWANGIVVVVAAGNGGPEPMTIGVPGNNPYVITVGAFTDNYTPNDWSDDYITPFSAAGPTLDGFVKPDVIAPGAHVVSRMEANDYMAKQYPETKVTKDYYAIAGTSQASAVVSGIAALVLAENPGLVPDQVKYRIMYSSAVWINPDTTEALYSMWQQGAGRVNAPGAVFEEFENAYANAGMDIWADLAGDMHYEGHTVYDETTGEFHLTGDYGSWAGGYGSWAGGYGSWAGGYGSWAGGYGSWAGGYGSWAGGYGSWAGGYGSWAGGYGSWAGGYGSWAGGYGSWAGGYGSWAGGYGSWAGSEPWTDSAYADVAFVENFLAGENPQAATTTTSIGIYTGE